MMMIVILPFQNGKESIAHLCTSHDQLYELGFVEKSIE
jgi:hypothetical protein